MLFFDSTHCVRCNRDTGACPACKRIVAFGVGPSGEHWCRGKSCLKKVRKCANNVKHGICNGYVFAEGTSSDLCDACCLTSDIPDLNVAENLARWRKLELAKRRVVRQLRDLKLLPQHSDGGESPLSFRFLADDPSGQPVLTGHAEGVVTVNIKEADDVEREKARVNFGERHRTLVGHFRHELGHYVWYLAWKDSPPDYIIEAFGDPGKTDYEQARQEYYNRDENFEWQQNYISRYATMHPWEDFAETFANYLDMIDTVETSEHFGFVNGNCPTFMDKLHAYERIGVAINELNRGVGVLDLVPEVFSPSVIEKLRTIDKAVMTIQTRGLWTTPQAPCSISNDGSCATSSSVQVP